jgi:undecaprenyl diphosphate synthase
MGKRDAKMMRRRLANAYMSSVISISLVLLLVGVACMLVLNARSVSDHFKENMERVLKRGVRLRVIGETQLLPDDVQKILRESEEATAHFAGKGVNIALCYGSRAEIVRAANLAVAKGEKVTEESFFSLLYTCGQPDPDLIIRTGKEIRLSNFLLWQAAYAELYFSDKMFPAFSDKDLEKAIEWFSGRTRRFGKTDEQL